MKNWRLVLCAIVIGCAVTACSSSAPHWPGQDYGYAETTPESFSDSGVTTTSSSRGRRSSAPAPASAPAPVPAPQAPQAATPETPETNVGARNTNAGSTESTASETIPPQTAPLLIYNGTVLLALYDVAETQTKILELVESEGGWVSTRSTNQLVLRVPAPKFRDLLDQVSKMGDLLDLKWQAEDVTTVVRDTRIRLDSALKMRARLEDLLLKAENVKDALAIEEQLGRVILEIEQLQATLRGFEDRIAYSTITVDFRPKTDRNLPANEYSLPFRWLDDLGVNRLLQIPRR